jgi:O-antigen ligase
MTPEQTMHSTLSRRFEAGAFWLLVVLLVWAPFPIGSNRPVFWSILGFLVMALWLLLTPVVWLRPEELRRQLALVKAPLVLAGLALLWAVIQTLPMPARLAHPIWELAGEVLEHDLWGSISLDPWQSWTSIARFLTYIMVFCVTFILVRDAVRARRLLAALVVIGVIYGLYAYVFYIFGWSQFSLFHQIPYTYEAREIAAPFINFNSFSPFAGLMALCALVFLVDHGSRTVVARRGFGPLFLTLTNYLFGRGVILLLAALILVSSVIIGGSRGGFLALSAGLFTLLALSLRVTAGQPVRRWHIAGIAALVSLFIGLTFLMGDSLAVKFDSLMAAGGRDETRLLLWDSALRMVEASPLLGLGLGSFEAAYPLYAEERLPLLMDRAHNDYLELAAGLGLPAAALWLSALLWLAVICARGVFIRRRDRIFPVLGVGATALVGVHSLVDFSLQIPAIALTYAVIMGMCVAQSFSSRDL